MTLTFNVRQSRVINHKHTKAQVQKYNRPKRQSGNERTERHWHDSVYLWVLSKRQETSIIAVVTSMTSREILIETAMPAVTETLQSSAQLFITLSRGVQCFPRQLRFRVHMYLPNRSQIVYNLRNRNDNKILIPKTSDLNERHCLIRVLYKHCY